MTQKILNNLDTMAVARGNINDNFTELYKHPLGAMNTNNEIISCSNKDTEYLIENHISCPYNENFVLENTGSKLKYTGDKAIFIMHGSYRLSPSDKNSIVIIRLKKNGVEISQSVFDFSALSDTQSSSKQYPVELDTNDYLEVTLESSTNGNDILMISHYLTNEFIKFS